MKWDLPSEESGFGSEERLIEGKCDLSRVVAAGSSSISFEIVSKSLLSFSINFGDGVSEC